MSENNNTIRTDWTDSLRALAIIGLLVSSVAGPALGLSFNESTCTWLTCSLFASATRFAVPLALMVAGAALLPKKYDLKTFYTVRFPLVLVPVLFWFIVYTLFRYFTWPDARPDSLEGVVIWMRDLFMQEGISSHFWLVFMMLALYLITPFLGNFIRKLKPSMLVFLLAAWVLASSIANDFNIDMHSWTGNQIPKLINYMVYAGYMVLGFYFYNVLYVSKNIRLSAWILYAGTVLVAISMSYLASKTDGKLNLAIYHDYGLNSMIQASAIFIAFKKTKTEERVLSWLQNSISENAVGIYMVHLMVLNLLYLGVTFWHSVHALIAIPLLSLLTLSTSWAIIYLVRKIPFIKNFAV